MQAIHRIVTRSVFNPQQRRTFLQRPSTSTKFRPPVMMMTQRASFSEQVAVDQKDQKEPTLQQRLRNAYELVQSVQRRDTIRYMCNDCVPIDLQGTMILPVIPERKYVTQYLDDKQVDRDFLRQYLFSMVQDFMEGLQKEDYDGLERFTEANFVNKLRENRLNAPDTTWFGYERVDYNADKVVTIDNIIVKGVGVDRSTNDDQIDYYKVTALESKGIRQFHHKYDFGMQDYYFMLRFQDELVKLTDQNWREENPEESYLTDRRIREGIHLLRKEMLSKQFRFLIRVILQIKNDGVGNFEYDADLERLSRGLGNFQNPNKDNHIAIFECQLKQPPILAMGDHTHLEYLMASRLNFTGWRLVDFDNFMKGNPPFTQLGLEDPWERLTDFKNLQDIVESENREKMDKEMQEFFIEGAQMSIEELDCLEPNSNARIGLQNATKTTQDDNESPNKGKKSSKDKKTESSEEKPQPEEET